jgi:DNA polymerase-3 subunit epsilon/ATP-dependent DNA helicase DinG
VTSRSQPSFPTIDTQSSAQNGVHPFEEEWVAIDVETTGLSPESDTIIEIGAVKFKGRAISDTFQSLINPQRKLGSFTRRFTGITQKEVETAPLFSSIAGSLEDFIGDLPIVGHNINFDLGFLSAQGFEISNPKTDTWDLAYVLSPLSTEYSLQKLASSFNIPQQRAHRALEDATVTSRLFCELVDHMESLDIYTLMEMQLLGTRSSWILSFILGKLVAHFQSEYAGTTPHEPGSKLNHWPPMNFTGIDVSELRNKLKHQPVLKPNNTTQSVDIDHVVSLLSEGGPISKSMANFEERVEQIEMAKTVTEAINESTHLIVEAGTGVGKSMAYLLPVILYALKNNRRVVVSTNTINLQEQLINKDLPALIASLRDVQDVSISDFKYSQLKGRNNYLCLKRWSHLRSNETISVDEARMLSKLLVWTKTTVAGDKSELNLARRGLESWEKVSAQGASECTGIDGTCFLRAARDRAAAAHLIIVNHALLITDITAGKAIIPEHDVLIVDEAQHLEDVATNHLGFQTSYAEISEAINLLDGEHGILNKLTPSLRISSLAQTRRKSLNEISQRIISILPKVREATATMFGAIEGFMGPRDNTHSGFAYEMPITTGTRVQPEWSLIEIQWDKTDVALVELDLVISALIANFETLSDSGILDYESLLIEIHSIRERVSVFKQHLQEAISDPASDGIYWLSRSNRSTTIFLNKAPLHVGDQLEKHLYSQRRSMILTSATLSTKGNFKHISERTGFKDSKERLLGSPFDYENSALVCVPKDLPAPNSWEYQAAIEQAIMDMTIAAGGATMALFTSYSSLQNASKAIRDNMEAHGIEILSQGINGAPYQLLRKFIDNPKSLLLGTSSFWEGVDLPGDSLRLLLVAKLPFSVPSDPVFSARSEQYESAFNEYALPQAILRLRQGFGRLIRTKSDRGVFVILDSRVASRGYGKEFIASLPISDFKTPKTYEMPEEIRKWLGNK